MKISKPTKLSHIANPNVLSKSMLSRPLFTSRSTGAPGAEVKPCSASAAANTSSKLSL